VDFYVKRWKFPEFLSGFQTVTHKTLAIVHLHGLVTAHLNRNEGFNL